MANTPNSEVTSNLKYIGDGNPDGNVLGKTSTEKIAFYGGTPAVRPTAPTAVATTASTTATPYGYATSTQADAIVTAVNLIISNLTTLGLWG